MTQPLSDDFYQLPEVLADYRPMYAELTQRLRAEAEGLLMPTIAELLIERIATNYVLLRFREANFGQAGGFEHSTAAKDANSFWLSMTKEFNSMTKTTPEDAGQRMLSKALYAINKTLEGMHPDVAGPLRERFASAMEEVGL